MTTSVLIGIINRLEAMIQSDGDGPEVRRFEINGEERCQVTYDATDQSFELKDRVNDATYRFDNIDLVAVEIFELLG